MAKSYVTKFTEYVAQQRDNLAEKLKSKKIALTDDYSLGSLVSQLDHLQESFKTYQYERDPNLPNIDEMFDNDPLRKVNGGQYAVCIYGILEIDKNGVIRVFKSSSSSTSSPASIAEKIIIGDGSEYSTPSSTIMHTVSESGIYTTTNGKKYTLVRYYSSVVPTYTTSAYIDPFIEMIDESFDRITWNYVYNSTDDDYMIPCGNGRLKYYRFVGSNGNKIQNMSLNTQTADNILKYCEVIVLDGVISSQGFSNVFPYYNKAFIDRRVLLGSSETATSISYQIGGGNYIYYSCDYLQLPISELPISFTISVMPTTLIIPDTEIKSITASSLNKLAKLHIGNRISSNFTLGSWAIRLTDVTVSPNAFSSNTTAITLDFSSALNLTHESLMNIINNVADRTDMTANIIKLNTQSKKILTDEEKAILTAKNWTLS